MELSEWLNKVNPFSKSSFQNAMINQMKLFLKYPFKESKINGSHIAKCEVYIQENLLNLSRNKRACDFLVRGGSYPLTSAPWHKNDTKIMGGG